MTESAFTKKTRLCGMLFTESSSAAGWNEYWKSTRVILEENAIPIYIKWQVILQSDSPYKEWISFTFLAFSHSTINRLGVLRSLYKFTQACRGNDILFGTEIYWFCSVSV